jgi:hypothetical protein
VSDVGQSALIRGTGSFSMTIQTFRRRDSEIQDFKMYLDLYDVECMWSNAIQVAMLNIKGVQVSDKVCIASEEATFTALSCSGLNTVTSPHFNERGL